MYCTVFNILYIQQFSVMFGTTYSMEQYKAYTAQFLVYTAQYTAYRVLHRYSFSSKLVGLCNYCALNRHHLRSDGAAVNTQSRSSLTSHAISRSLSQVNRIWLWMQNYECENGDLWRFFHCMVRHGTVRYGSLLGGFPLGTVPGTWYFFSTTSVEVPSEPYRYQNVTCKLCWSLIGRRESSLLRHWTCDTRPSSTALPARFKSAQPSEGSDATSV